MTALPANEVGDADGFRLLLTPHLGALRRFAASLVRPDDVDDLVQDTVARAWTKRGQFDPARGSLVAWVMAIMADRARGHWRLARAALQLHEPDRVTSGPDDGAALDLRRAINALPNRQRATVIFFYYIDLPVSEIAVRMKCSPGTVKSALFDARRSLATHLGEGYVRSE